MKLYANGVFLSGGAPGAPVAACGATPETARKNTMAWQVLSAHNQGNDQLLRLRFDALISHDITYVGVIQQARFSGMESSRSPTH